MLTCLCGDVQCVQSVVGLQRKRREDNLELMLGSCPTCPLSGPCLDGHCPLIYISRVEVTWGKVGRGGG